MGLKATKTQTISIFFLSQLEKPLFKSCNKNTITEAKLTIYLDAVNYSMFRLMVKRASEHIRNFFFQLPIKGQCHEIFAICLTKNSTWAPFEQAKTVSRKVLFSRNRFCQVHLESFEQKI